MQLNVQPHQALYVAKHQVCLFSERVVSSLPEVLGAQLDLALVLSLVQQLADVHD